MLARDLSIETAKHFAVAGVLNQYTPRGLLVNFECPEIVLGPTLPVTRLPDLGN